nr:ATP-binding cassette domain-containing protein [Deinococcus kurensis]
MTAAQDTLAQATFTLATALLGANSAGKTTLLRALCSLIPSEAHILIAGLSPADPAARRTVGLVNQRLLGHPN